VSDLAELYVVLVLIYLFECAAFVPRRALGLGRRFGRWGVRRALAPGAGWLRGFVVGEPWPPLSAALVTEPLPLVAGPDGLRAGDGAFVRWEDAGQITARAAQLMVGGQEGVPLATRRGAQVVAEALDGLGARPRADRERRLRRWLDARFDDAAVETRLPAMRRDTRAARVAANLLWASVFVGLPVLLWTPLAAMFLAVGAVAVAAWLAAAVLFERALRRSRWLVPAWRPELAKRIAAVASPIATIRACDHIARELAGDLDPLAAAAPLLPAAALGALGRARLVDLKYRRADAAEGGEADLAWWQGEILTRVERTLRARGIDPEALLAAPARDGADVIAWCPNCLQQYRGGADAPTACANPGCEGITLRAFT
jgi:hypothetical protein